MEKLVASQPPEREIDIHWRSFELRPKSAPPISADYLEKIEAGRPRLYATARETYGLEMNPGPFGIDSRPALIGAKFAEAAGMGAAYTETILRSYWQEEMDISDLDVLTDLAVSIGLNREDFARALTGPAYIALVDQDIEMARSYGLNSVPSLVFDNKYLIPGAQPLEALQNAVDTIVAENPE